MQTVLLLALLASTGVLGLAGPARAHARLVATEPAAGQTITDAPEIIHLTYSEPIEESFSGVQVFDPAGERVDEGAPIIVGAETTVPIGPMARPGTYTVVFRVIGSDGHPVESRFTFVFEPDTTVEPSPTPTATPSAPETTNATPVPADQPEPSPTDTEVAVPPLPTEGLVDDITQIDPASIELQDAGSGTDLGLLVARVLDYLALVVIAAGLVGGILLYRGVPAADDRRRSMRRLVRLGGVSLVVAGGMVFVYGLSAAAAEPLPQVLLGSVPARFAATRFGTLVLAQAALGLAIVVGASRTDRRTGLWLTLGAAGAAAALPGLWGHAGTTSPVPLAVATDWSHVVASAAWVGGLAVLVVHTTRQPASQAVDPVLRFSQLAGVVIWVVLASGVFSALLHIGAVDQLTGTGYGRLVIAKTLLFVGIAALGWRNRSRAIPRLRREVRDGDGTSALGLLRRLAAAEVALMLIALGVAGGLASSIPAEAEAAGRVEFVAAALTDEDSVNVTFDPARPGTNVMHIYVLGHDGRPRAVDDADISLTLDGRDIPADLVLSGPGHYTALNQQFPEAGDYAMEIAIDIDGEVRRATATVVIQ